MKSLSLLYKCIFVLFFLFISFQSQSREKITFSCVLDGSSILRDKLVEIYTSAFDKLNYDFELILAPRKRSLHSATKGDSDGECGRSFNYSKRKSARNLIRINTPIFNSNIGVWGKNSNENLDDFFSKIQKKKYQRL